MGSLFYRYNKSINQGKLPCYLRLDKDLICNNDYIFKNINHRILFQS